MTASQGIYVPNGVKVNTYNEELNKLKTTILIQRIVICLLAVATSVVIMNCLGLRNTITNMQEKSASYRKTVSKQENLISDLNGKITQYASSNAKLITDTNGLANVVNSMQSNNKILEDQNKSLSDQLNTLQQRAELYDKYQYAVINSQGGRTDITYSQLKTGEELCKQEGIDPNLLFGIIMTESGGIETASNSGSTATGFGQLLYGTARYIWQDKLGLGTYTSSVALNGDNNIKLTIGYLDYLKNDQGLNTLNLIRRYRGKQDVSSYVSRINSYIGKVGANVYKM